MAPTLDAPPPHVPSPRFTPLERRVVTALTALFGLRMLGYHLVLPVFAPYAATLRGSTPMLVGLSLGVYGLTQTIFQVPFGTWSDRWGRRPVLTLGLALFALGSVVCAEASDAWVLLVGRLIQGMGAMASVAVATVADLTREEVRTRAMAMIGVVLGASFASGLLVGPWATARFGVPAIFWFTAALCMVGIAYLWWQVPEPPRLVHHDDLEYSRDHLFEVLRNRHLVRLNLGAFNLHMSLTAIFVTAPFFLERLLRVDEYWKLFLPMITLGFIVLLLGARLAEKAGRGKKVLLAGQGLQVAALVVLALIAPASVYQEHVGLTALVVGILLFVCAFALLEPLLPALLTRLSQQANRGTAVGVFNMSQFSGAFVGGLVSGAFLGRNVEALYWILAALGATWFVVALRFDDPRHMRIHGIDLPGASVERKRDAVRALLRIRGVEDVAWDPARERLHVRYAAGRVEPGELERAVGDGSAAGAVEV